MTTPVHGDLGAALRLLRTRAGLTQEQVATRAGLDAPYLSRVESGFRDIRWSTLQRLLSAIGADLRELGEAVSSAEDATDEK